MNFFPRALKNIHVLSLVCKSNILFPICIWYFANLPFWSGDTGYIHSVASNLSLVFGPHPSFLQGISCLQTPLFMVELFWWLPSSTFLLPPVSPILPLLNSLLVGEGFLTKMVLNEMEFCILLLCPKFWVPVLFLSRLQQNISIFLLMERLEYFMIRIIFFQWMNLLLFPLNWFFFWI